MWVKKMVLLKLLVIVFQELYLILLKAKNLVR